MGATAYLILENSAEGSGQVGNILVDCPAWDDGNRSFLQSQGGARWLVLTHRGGIGKVRDIQQALGCEVVIQEQEAYLLPRLEVTTFHKDFTLSARSRMIWTPGHSPGSACLHCDRHGGILFSGRHLLPDRHGSPMPLRTAKTFHWPRQIRSVQHLLQEFTPETLSYICPGANTGFLRGKRAVDQAYHRLAQLDLNQCMQAKPLL